MKIHRLAPGLHETEPMHCPACGLSITRVSGMKRGSLRDGQRIEGAVRVMVCARCEVAIARCDGSTFVLDAVTEATLPIEVKQALVETRNQLRIDKATGRIVVPAEGP